jgi:hypothetical protein
MIIHLARIPAGAVALLFATNVSAQTATDAGAMSNVTQSRQYQQMADADDPKAQAGGLVDVPQNPNQPRTAHTGQKTGHAGKTNHHTSIKGSRGFAPGTVEPGTPNK